MKKVIMLAGVLIVLFNILFFLEITNNRITGYHVFSVSNTNDNSEINLSNANATLYGINNGDLTGHSVWCADVNNDGFGDAIIGAEEADANGLTNSGKVYVVYGSQTMPSLINLSEANIIIKGTIDNNWIDWTVFSMDINNDNIDDLLIQGKDSFSKSQIYIIYGGSLNSSINSSDADVVINGVSSDDGMGWIMSSGDINNDSIDDLIAGAYNIAKTYIIFGSNSLPSEINISTDANIIIHGINNNDYLGVSVSSGDINNDGVDDILVGASRVDVTNAGQVYVIYGNNSLPSCINVSIDSDIVLNGISGSNAGKTLSSNDVNGDNIDDIIIGAYCADSYGKNRTGQAYVIYGNSSLPSEINLSRADVIINGINANDLLGDSLYSNDINNDKISDIIIGAYSADPHGMTNAGQVYVIYGSDSLPSEINVSTNISTINGAVAGDSISNDKGIASCDINNDYANDILIGAKEAETTQRGKAYILFMTSSCVEDWIDQYGSCLANGTQLKYYIDQNECGHVNDLPIDNGTYINCDCGISDCTGLVGLWHMDEANWSGASNEVIDFSGYNHHGTAMNGLNTTAEGMSGRAGSFDGVDDYVELTDFNISDNFTLSLWVNANSTQDEQSFIAKNTYSGANILYLGYWNNSYCVGFRISFDPHANNVYCGGTKITGWQHLVLLAEKLNSSMTNVKLYRNGTKLLQQNFSYVFEDISGKPWVIGQEWDIHTPTDFFKGIIDEVSIWDRALSTDEILLLGAVCTENWTVQYRDCLVNDSKLKYYIDQNNCNTTNNLPADNGTYVACDYCIPSWICVDYNQSGYCNETADSNDCYSQTGLGSDQYSGDYSEFDSIDINLSNPVQDAVNGSNVSSGSASNETFNSSTVPSIDIEIDGLNLSYWKTITGVLEVDLNRGNKKFAEFDYNFSNGTLNLNDLQIEQGSLSTGAVKGYVLIKGLDTERLFGANKTLYLNNLDTNLNWVCVKDTEISDISEISSNCKGTNEHHVQCNGQLYDNRYTCVYNSPVDQYKIDGLQHSGVLQADAPVTETVTVTTQTRKGLTITKYTIGEEPKTVVMRLIDKTIFYINERLHYAQIKKIYSDHITLVIHSDSFDVDLYINQTKKIDVDENGVYDLAMTLEEIYASSAKIRFEVIEEKIIEEREIIPEEEVLLEETLPEEVPEEIPSISTEKKILTYILVIGAIVLLGYFLLKKKKRKKRSRRKK